MMTTTNRWTFAGFASLVARLTRVADEKIVKTLADQAADWQFTESLRYDLGYCYGLARSHYNVACRQYVRRYYRRMGRYPVGHHRFDPRSRMGAFFPPHGASCK